MALSLANAIEEVRYILNEPTQVFWSDTEITAWIKEGVRDFSSKALMYENVGTITLATGKLYYTSVDAAFLADMIEPYSCLYYDGSSYKGIIKIHPRMVGNEATNTTGEPKYYAVHGRNFFVWPATSDAVVAAGGTLTVLYAKETDDITVLKDEFQHLPMLYAAAKAKMKDQKFAEATSLMTMYLNFVAFERQDKHAREEDTLDMFKVKPRGGQGAAG